MKQDILNTFREYLNGKFNKNTADRYYFAVKDFFSPIQFSSVEDIQDGFIEESLQKLTTKNSFSAVKNGLKNMKELFPEMKIPGESEFKELSLRKRNRSKKKGNTLYLDTIRRKINGLKDDKYKYAYRLMEKSGLRVSELSNLKKNDIKISENNIEINISKGKGGKSGQVTITDDYLSKRLKEFIKNADPEEFLFPAAKTLKNKANKINLECHDFRRIAAINFKKKMKKQGLSEEEANKETKDFLRHSRFSTTKRYLYNKKLKIKQSEDKQKIKLPEIFNYLSTEKKKENEEILNKFTNAELDHYMKTIKNEPQISQDIQQIITSTGGDMGGFAYRIKTPKSVYEKIYERKTKTKIKRLDDIIRYTGIYKPDELSAQTNNSIKALEMLGYTVNKIKNTWNDENSAYKGIKVILTSPQGQKFELQYHTEESFKVKDGEMHSLYEKARVLDPQSEEALKIQEKMFELSDVLKKPKNIEEVKER